MTTTPKPDVNLATRSVSEYERLLAEAPTLDLPEDHPYWEVPDELRRGMHWDRDLKRFTARCEIARRLADDHGWTIHFTRGSDPVAPVEDRQTFEVRPPERPKVTQVPAREVAKRLIDGEDVRLSLEGEERIADQLGSNVYPGRAVVLGGVAGWATVRFPWDSTVPVIEDGAS